METKEIQTLGEQRVRVDFNVSGDTMVDQIKRKSADLINDLEAVRNSEVSKTYEKSPEALQSVSGEKLRLIAIAQTKYEEACMFAVKACTT